MTVPKKDKPWQPYPGGFGSGFEDAPAWAAMYRYYGLQVIPGYPKGKRPALREWTTLQMEMVPIAVFDRWYGPNGEHIHNSNMGMLTGAASHDAFILDLDIHKTPSAWHWWNALLEEHNNGFQLETPTQVTGGGGLQLLFRAPPGWRSPTNKTAVGVDIRGQAGFAVLPPSLHESGRTYAWKPGLAPWEVPILEAPPWLVEAIDALVGHHPSGEPAKIAPRASYGEPLGQGEVFDAWGKRIDGREEYMRDYVWAALIGLRAEGAAMPGPTIMGEQWGTYELHTRAVVPGKVERSKAEFEAKWRYALKHWNGKIAEAAKLRIEQASLEQSFDQPAPQQPLDPAKPLVLTAEQFVDGFTPPDYLIDGIVQRGYIYSLTARTNHGKTAVSMYIAQAIARGEPVHNREVLQGTVLLLAGENPDDIRARFIVLGETYGFDPRTIKMRFIAGVVKLPERIEEIKAVADTIDDLVLVIVDTSAAYFPYEDVNDNKQQLMWAQWLRWNLTTLRGKPCVLVNCHPVKNAEQNNMLPMGGSAFANEIDGNLTLWANNEKQTKLHWFGKFRGIEFEPLYFQLVGASSPKVADAKGRAMPSVVAKPMTELEVAALTVIQQSDEDKLLSYIHDDPDASFNDLAVRAAWINDKGQPAKSKVQRIIERLVKDKLIAKHRGDKYRLTAKGKKEIGADGGSDE